MIFIEKRWFIGDNLRVKLAEIITKEFGEKDLETHLSRIQECVEKTDLFNVYDMDASSGFKDIDEAILHALLRGIVRLTIVINRLNLFDIESHGVGSVVWWLGCLPFNTRSWVQIL